MWGGGGEKGCFNSLPLSTVSFFFSTVPGEPISTPRCHERARLLPPERERSPRERASFHGDLPAQPLLRASDMLTFPYETQERSAPLDSGRSGSPASTEIELAFDLRGACWGGRKGRGPASLLEAPAAPTGVGSLRWKEREQQCSLQPLLGKERKKNRATCPESPYLHCSSLPGRMRGGRGGGGKNPRCTGARKGQTRHWEGSRVALPKRGCTEGVRRGSQGQEQELRPGKGKQGRPLTVLRFCFQSKCSRVCGVGVGGAGLGCRCSARCVGGMLQPFSHALFSQRK